MMLPEPLCQSGYPWYQIEEDILTDEQLTAFSEWMYGQTMTLCQGRRYNHEAKRYEQSCDGQEHGVVVYPWDLGRFLAGGQIVD